MNTLESKSINLLIDFDSTIIKDESLELLSEISVKNSVHKTKIVEITRDAMDGKIGFSDALKERVVLLKSKKEQLKDVIATVQNRLTDSFIQNKDFFKQNSPNCHIISGGFIEIIYPILKPFNISKKNIFANQFIYDNDENIISIDDKNPLSKDKGKVEVAKNISKKLGLDLEKQFEYSNASEIWDEMSNLTPIMKGINHQRLKQEGGIQWPCPDTSHPGTRFLYADSFPRGERAKFVGFKQGPPAEEMPSKRFPLILNTGRILYHWHGGTITKRSEELLKRSPELEININPDDGSKYSINDGEVARIISKRGKLEGKIVFSDKMRSGEIFIPFVKLNKFAANFLTNSAYDPTSKIPEYKVCAVRIENVN